MSWQFDPLAALSELKGTPAKVAKVAKVGPRPPASDGTLAALAGLAAPTLQDEKAVGAQPSPPPAPAAGPVAPLTPPQAKEVRSWPPATQRVFVAALERFERQGYGLTQAEALAFATVKTLMSRHGGPVGFREDLPAQEPERPAMPQEVAPLVEAAREVWPGLEASWEPEQPWTCYACKGSSYFLNTGGGRVCSRCHPPLDPVQFLEVQPLAV